MQKDCSSSLGIRGAFRCTPFGIDLPFQSLMGAVFRDEPLAELPLLTWQEVARGLTNTTHTDLGCMEPKSRSSSERVYLYLGHTYSRLVTGTPVYVGLLVFTYILLEAYDLRMHAAHVCPSYVQLSSRTMAYQLHKQLAPFLHNISKLYGGLLVQFET